MGEAERGFNKGDPVRQIYATPTPSVEADVS
jgi:hypothetical protein